MSREKRKDRQASAARGKKKPDAIPLTGKSLVLADALFGQMQLAKERLDCFLGGVRTASGVPDDWVFHAQAKAFIPRPKGMKAGEAERAGTPR